ncbi:hypothetical protein BG006_000262 [Podila minutissima]|uniref:SMP domain-containing protein n=1 Tax=Podila minutissima TaxID=64525 RepID=A0A9P5SFH7_9FUNG|nr:hypothetical protein BG006_000262 [Podila minutissima]
MNNNPSQTGGRSQGTAMTSEDASRIQSAADRNPSAPSATSEFKERAQSAAARNAESTSARNESAGDRKK